MRYLFDEIMQYEKLKENLNILKSLLVLSRHLISQNRIDIAVFSSLKCFVEIYHAYFVTMWSWHPFDCISVENCKCYSLSVRELTVNLPPLNQNSLSFTGSQEVLRAMRYFTYCN